MPSLLNKYKKEKCAQPSLSREAVTTIFCPLPPEEMMSPVKSLRAFVEQEMKKKGGTVQHAKRGREARKWEHSQKPKAESCLQKLPPFFEHLSYSEAAKKISRTNLGFCLGNSKIRGPLINSFPGCAKILNVND